jgi:2-iminobutanoate/2-iminopropanoate deaminase
LKGETELPKKVFETEEAPRPAGPYSQGLAAGGFLFVSGQTPLDPSTGEMVNGDVGAQTERALKNIAAILEAAGSGLERVVKTNVFLVDMNDFAAMNEAYGRFFKTQPPARTTVGVAALPLGARVEIEAVAALGP